MKAAEPARIVFLDRDTMPADISLRPFAFPHELLEFGATKPDQVAERIASADIVITNKAPIRSESPFLPTSRISKSLPMAGAAP